jgi:hypothetical protein
MPSAALRGSARGQTKTRTLSNGDNNLGLVQIVGRHYLSYYVELRANISPRPGWECLFQFRVGGLGKTMQDGLNREVISGISGDLQQLRLSLSRCSFKCFDTPIQNQLAAGHPRTKRGVAASSMESLRRVAHRLLGAC